MKESTHPHRLGNIELCEKNNVIVKYEPSGGYENRSDLIILSTDLDIFDDVDLENVIVLIKKYIEIRKGR